MGVGPPLRGGGGGRDTAGIRAGGKDSQVRKCQGGGRLLSFLHWKKVSHVSFKSNTVVGGLQYVCPLHAPQRSFCHLPFSCMDEKKRRRRQENTKQSWQPEQGATSWRRHTMRHLSRSFPLSSLVPREECCCRVEDLAATKESSPGGEPLTFFFGFPPRSEKRRDRREVLPTNPDPR